MKSRFAVVAFLCAASVIACIPRAGVPIAGRSSAELPSALPLITDEKSGFCLLNGLSFWDVTEGKLRAKGALQIGEKLSLSGRRARLVQSGREREFLEARRESDALGWVRSDYLAVNSVLAVVTSEEVVLYAQPRNTGATGATLPFGTVLAIEKESAAQVFVRVAVYSSDAQKVLRNVFLRNEGISSRLSEVESAILLELAGDAANSKQRQAFLSSALKDYPTSSFASRIRAELAGSRPAAAESAVVSMTATFVTNQEKVNVLSAPDDASASVVATLAKGQSVDAVEKTAESSRIGSLSAPWYRIKDPPGWVFGTFLSETP